MRRKLGSWLAHSIAVVRRRPWAAAAGSDGGALLERVIADLDGLNRGTEEHFLAIGGKLMGFVTGARQLSSDMAALEQIFGSQDGQASQVLSRVLEQSKQMEARAATGDQELAGICGSARQIGRTFRGFQDTVSVFRVLGSLTRIETARLGNAGEEFGNLAEEVTTLTGSIESSGKGILDASAALHETMQYALAKVTGLRASELAELPALIAEIRTGLGSLEDRQRRAVEVFVRQAAEYEKVSAAFEDLITAIQFHDITRQQVEHVADALRRVRGEFEEGSRNPPATRLNVRAVLALQSSQLANAQQVFESSVGRIERNLDGIAERVREMAQTGKTLLGSSTNAQDSFFAQMEGRFTAILRVVGTCAEAEKETQGVLAGLEAAVKHMQASVAEIRQIEIRIRRMAINATIRAVQIGDAGVALNVIADVMQRLASDAGAITDTVAGDLGAIDGAAERLSGGAGWTPGGEEGSATAGVLPEMHAAMAELHVSSEASFSRLNQITATSAVLGEQIRSVRARFLAGTVFTDTIRGACRSLEEIGVQAGSEGEDSQANVEQHLAGFAEQYTMQAEREVHESMTGGAVSVPGPDNDGPAGEELGANVELF